jgi:hypothetical protein
MSPEKTKPMNRQAVRYFLEAVWGKEKFYDLHDEKTLSFYMSALHHTKNSMTKSEYLPEYNNVMGSLLHYWKQS